jgi:hypothetical protein
MREKEYIYYFCFKFFDLFMGAQKYFIWVCVYTNLCSPFRKILKTTMETKRTKTVKEV